MYRHVRFRLFISLLKVRYEKVKRITSKSGEDFEYEQEKEKEKVGIDIS